MITAVVVLIHVSVALLSVAFSSLVFFKPTKAKLKLTYGLIGSTLVSGTYLVFTTPAHDHLGSACLAGLIYLCVVMAGIVPANLKLTKQTHSS